MEETTDTTSDSLHDGEAVFRYCGTVDSGYTLGLRTSVVLASVRLRLRLGLPLDGLLHEKGEKLLRVDWER